MCDFMELIEILKPDFVFEDQRGTLTQITHNQFAQTNAVFTKANQIRGNYHYHRFTKEVFFIISGEVRVHAKLSDQKKEYLFKSGDMFLIPEEVKHRFDFLQDTYLVAFYTNRVELEDGTKDLVSD